MDHKCCSGYCRYYDERSDLKEGIEITACILVLWQASWEKASGMFRRVMHKKISELSLS